MALLIPAYSLFYTMLGDTTGSCFNVFLIDVNECQKLGAFPSVEGGVICILPGCLRQPSIPCIPPLFSTIA